MRTLACRWVCIIALAVLSGCGGGTSSGSAKGEPETDSEATPEERKYIDAAKPFVAAIAGRKYDEAYALLSSHAKARMSRNQFKPEDDDAKFEASEKNPMTGVSAEKFAEMMKLVEKEYGQPQRMNNLHVHSLEAKILSGNASSNEDKLDAMFAIGNMPKSIPANIRKASLRVQIVTQLSDAEMAKVAKEMNTTVEELKKDENFRPYFTLKMVLVEESGLKVGYFEFLPPSMMD
ncbi:MAG TPA: hypothetical protein VEJ63_01270 [Planctomycetota bacterium]|nr:hypothetical protein [Planctomycetota bacterium]